MMRDFFPPAGHPCPQCGVRPDVGCRHRAADPDWQPPDQPGETDRRKVGKGSRPFNQHRTISGGGAYRIAVARAAGLSKESAR